MSGAKSDTADAHVLADMVRTDGHQLRPVAGDSAQAEAVKVVTRAHKTLIWERTRHVLRLRTRLREFFPAALVAFDDLAAADALELLATAPDPTRAATLTISQISAALTRARRRDRTGKAAAIQAPCGHARSGPARTVATPPTRPSVRAQVRVLHRSTSRSQRMEDQVEAHFGKHPDAEVYLSQPGLGAGPRRPGARRVR